MSYELFRTTYASRIMDRLPPELFHDVMQDLDIVANDYEIKRACTDLIVASEMPQVVELYLAALAVENKSPCTVKDYFRVLKKFFFDVRKPFNTITTNDIRVWMFNYQQRNGINKRTLDHYRTVVKAFFSWLVDEELLTRNPAAKIAPIDVPETCRTALPTIELEWLRLACQDDREKALVDFLYSTGCRISECAAVNLADLNWIDRSVKIRHGKGDKFRIVYFNAESEVSLRKYLDNRKQESPVLFCSRRKPYGNVSREALEADVRKIRDRVANLSVTVTPHILRHTFATTAICNGMPIQVVQELMGHASLDTTNIYVHSNQEETRHNYRKAFAG